MRRTALLIATLIGLVACNADRQDEGSGQLKLSVADAPVDGAQAVVVKFTQIEVRRTNGEDIRIPLAEPRSIDLLHDSGTASAVLFDQQTLPAAPYAQIRLVVEADGDADNSYITLSDGSQHGLLVPSGDLRLVSGFDVPEGGVASFTVDFDLRKAIVCPPGQNGVCFLRPALRLVPDDSVGAIAGVVDAALITEGCSPGVYLYSGNVTEPDDMDSSSANVALQPVASKVPVVTAQSAGGYAYQFGFLAPGAYTVALTCQAGDDDPDQADEAVTFDPVRTGIAVSAGQTAAANLP